MKKLLIFIFLFAFWQTTQAQTNVDSLLCKTWKVHIEQTLSQMSAAKKARYDSLSNEQKSNIVQDFSTRYFAFDTNHSLTITWQKQGQTFTRMGTWVWATSVEGYPTLQITLGNQKTLYQLQTLSESQLVWFKPALNTDLFQKLVLNHSVE